MSDGAYVYRALWHAVGRRTTWWNALPLSSIILVILAVVSRSLQVHEAGSSSLPCLGKRASRAEGCAVVGTGDAVMERGTGPEEDTCALVPGPHM